MNDIFRINNVKSICMLVLIFAAGFFLGRLIQFVKGRAAIKQNRKDAIKKSRAVIGGQVAEQVAPFLPGFPCNPGDVSFLGKPVDFVAFCGLAEKDKIEEVVFIEVKTGQSKLNGHEKQLKDAVKNGRVRYVEYCPEL
ncbi:MAG: Holliday junction resolvase-like protein [Treponema sp.]|nr:Holliday junction resolvase-like protein [Spirochaetales bacterium]MDY5812710.1 Holliday junction resolvase-like protein [Treponema sp.]MEE1181183.1 Holliday junction resolvase-like protein [Treponema sp.]